jgi:hypothetical protein
MGPREGVIVAHRAASALLVVAAMAAPAGAQQFTAASVGVVDPVDGVVMGGSTLTLRGSGFAAGGEASIYLDNIKASRVGTVAVGPGGQFEATVRLPTLPPGPHAFLVLESKPGTASSQFVTATVGIRVKAAAP